MTEAPEVNVDSIIERLLEGEQRTKYSIKCIKNIISERK